MIRRLFCLVAMLTTVAITASRADASSFTLDSFTVSYNSTTPGLALWETSLLSGPTDFTLNNVGDTFSTALFRLGTNDSSLNLTDLIPQPISVAFNFSNPLPGFGGISDGLTGAAWFGTSFGYVVWDNPALLSFGTNGLLGVTLSNAAFGMPGYAAVNGTFTLVRPDGGTTSVPEPATLPLMAIGFAAILLVRARRPLAQF